MNLDILRVILNMKQRDDLFENIKLPTLFTPETSIQVPRIYIKRRTLSSTSESTSSPLQIRSTSSQLNQQIINKSNLPSIYKQKFPGRNIKIHSVSPKKDAKLLIECYRYPFSPKTSLVPNEPKTPSPNKERPKTYKLLGEEIIKKLKPSMKLEED